jgi:hypothetical protein
VFAPEDFLATPELREKEAHLREQAEALRNKKS